MAEDVNFAEILNQEANSTPPPPVPAGSYAALVLSHKFDKSSQKQTPFVEFAIKLVQPQDDVDQDALKDFGGMEKLANKAMALTFYLTPDAMWRLAAFFENTLNFDIEGRPYDELIPECNNQQFMAIITHTLSKDRKSSYANIDSTASLD